MPKRWNLMLFWVVVMFSIACAKEHNQGTNSFTHLLPQLKNPRILSIKDYKKKWKFMRDQIQKHNYTFIMEGDFNKDGVVDVALVLKSGEYNCEVSDVPYDMQNSASFSNECMNYVAIISDPKSDKPQLKYLKNIKNSVACFAPMTAENPNILVFIGNVDEGGELVITWENEKYVDIRG